MISWLLEKQTSEVPWQVGDIACINNKRVLHVLRSVTGDLTDREIFIGMGDQFSIKAYILCFMQLYGL